MVSLFRWVLRASMVSMRTAREVAEDKGALCEEIETTAIDDMPRRVVVQALRSDGNVVELVFSELGAHKASDELLKRVAELRRSRIPAEF